MQFIPIIPRSGKLLEDWLEVKRLAAVRASRPAEPRSLPPLVHQPSHPQLRQLDAVHEERRTPDQPERRKYCRRIQKLPVLEELRSSVERRKHDQRGSDPASHIDEEV